MADFGLRIGIEGERDFKAALRDINQSFRVLGSEMALVTSQFDKNDKSMSSLTSRNTVLRKEIEAQRDKVETLKAALDNASSSFGENDSRTKNWQIQLNKAQAELNGMERELKNNEKALDNVGDEMKDTGKETDNLGNELDDTGESTKDLGKEMDETGKKTSVFGDVLKASLVSEAIIAGLKSVVNMVKSVGSAIGDFVGKMVIQGGFDRAMNIEQARFKLKGLGHDAENVDAIMENALNSVRGTAYGLGDAATVAASAVAAGVQTGEELERTLRLVADASAISGRSMEEMGAVFNKIAASNKVTGREVNQLLQAGIPITQLLSETLGVSVEEVNKLVSEGKVGMPEFQDAVEKGMGGAALAIGGTFQGSVANAKAAFARIGESFLTPLTQSLTPALGIITGLVDDIGKGTLDNVDSKISELQDILSEAGADLIGAIEPLIKNAITIVSALLPMVINVIVDILPSVVTAGISLVFSLLDGIISVLPKIAEAGLTLVLGLVNGIIAALPQLITAAVQIITALVQGLTAAIPTLIPTIIDAVILICQTLVENLPMLLDAALQLILGLTQGLLDAIPQLVDALPAIIIAIVDFVLGAIPQIIDAGIQLLVSLVDALPKIITAIVAAIPKIIDGLIKAVLNSIPQIINAGIRLLASLVQALPQIINSIIQAIPQIITGIINAVVRNIPQIIKAGVQLLVSLVQNLPTIIKEIVKAIPLIITGIVTAIIQLIPELAKAGLELIKGLWQGISDAGAWLRDKISGFFGGVVSSIKNFFGIKSPSTLFRDLFGKNMALGIGVGFAEEMENVAKEMQEAIPTEFDTNVDINAGITSAIGDISGGAGVAFSIANLGIKLDGLAVLMSQMIEALDMKIVLDDGTLVGKLTPDIDRNLALLRKRGLVGV